MPPAASTGRGGGVAHLGHQHHGGQIAHMAAGLPALGDDGGSARLGHQLGHAHTGHHGDHLDASLQPHGHVAGGVPGAGGHHRHLLLGHQLGHLLGEGGHQHDVYAKGLVGQAAGQVDLLFQILGVGVHGGDNPQAAAVGNGRRQLPVGNPGHAALENGVLNAQKVADGRFNHDIPSFPGGLGPPVKILYPAARQPKSRGRCPVLILPPDDTCRGGKAAAKGGKHHIVAPAAAGPGGWPHPAGWAHWRKRCCHSGRC